MEPDADQVFRGGCEHVAGWVLTKHPAAAASTSIVVHCPVCGPVVLRPSEPLRTDD